MLGSVRVPVPVPVPELVVVQRDPAVGPAPVEDSVQERDPVQERDLVRARDRGLAPGSVPGQGQGWWSRR